MKTIEPQAFETELQNGDEPILVAFLKKNERFLEQSRVLERASSVHPKLHCYMYDVDYLDMGMERFKVKGTPTFLLFAGGKEVDRLIGDSDQDTLDEFIRSAMLSV